MIEKKITTLALVMFTLSSLFYCYEFFIQVSPSVMADSLMREFHAPATTLGIMSGFFYYSYAFMQVPGGLLLDRFGARIILTIVILICALGAFIFGIATNVSIAALGRLLMGMGAGVSFVSALYIIIRWIPIAYIALFIGLTQLLGSLGAIGGEAPLAAIINHMGWRQAMILFSVIGVILAISTALIIRDAPQKQNEATQEAPPVLRTLRTVLSHPQTWYVGLYSFAIWVPVTAFAALWGVPFLRITDHVSEINAANSIAFIWIGVAIGSPLIGWISDKIERRNIPLTISALIGVISTILIIYIPFHSLVMIDFLLFCVGLSASGQSLVFALIRDNNHINTTGAANGFNNMVIVLTGAIFQPLIGKLLDLNWHGLIQNGVRVYTLEAYHSALIILPLAACFALVISQLFIKETFCKVLK